MSWNIEKPGDRINGPVTITGNTTLTGAATISGDLTVDTSTLKVDSANNRVGVGTASPSVPLDVVGNAKVSGDLVVDTNTLVVDSTNNRLGIGTASPANKEHIEISPSATQLDGLRVTDSTRVAIFGSTGSTYNYRGIGANEVAVYANAPLNIVADGSVIKFTAGSGSESARIDSSGNLGLGVTPYGWSASIKSFDFGLGSLYSVTDTVFAHNAYVNTSGAWTYKTNAGSSYLQQFGGAFKFFTVTGSTGTITWGDPKMTLDASGNLRVGAAAAAGALTVTNSTTNTSIGLVNLSGYANTNTNSIDFYLDNSNSGVVSHGVIGCINTAATANRYGELFFKTASAAAPVTRMRIKSSGQLNFVPLASDPPAAEAGDVYYNSSTNKLRCYNGTSWNDLF